MAEEISTNDAVDTPDINKAISNNLIMDKTGTLDDQVEVTDETNHLQAKIDQLLSEIDVDKMLGEVQTAMQPLQDKIADMSQSIFARVDEMGRKIAELEDKISQAINSTRVSMQS
ncbi:MAG: Heat shock factor-binding protein 1 [Paramarteilia canceri]